MSGPVAAYLDGGKRLHLQHGPIDLIIGADAESPEFRDIAFAAASACFATLLDGLVAGLARHRCALAPDTALPSDPVARRMYLAARPFCTTHFLTPMIAVAGSVADAVLAAMLRAVPLTRAYVNNGGDIAVHLGTGAEFAIAMAAPNGADLGRVRFDTKSGIGGIATSGVMGRSLSLGIADSVTVLARDAATADVAATLIANAVDLPDHPGVIRQAASALDPDSDLGDRRVVTAVPSLNAAECDRALAAGRACAAQMQDSGLILGAALFLQGKSALAGTGFCQPGPAKEVAHA